MAVFASSFIILQLPKKNIASREKETRINTFYKYLLNQTLQIHKIFKQLQIYNCQYNNPLGTIKMGSSQTKTVTVTEYVQDPALLKRLKESEDQIQQLKNREPEIRYQTEYITEYKTEYKTDPSVLAQIRELRKQLKEEKDPTKIPQKIKQMKETIWASFKQINFPVSEVGKRIIFVGRTSSGKSSLLNCLFKPKTPLATSKGPCTTEISVVVTWKDVCIFDCPGFDTHFDLTKQPAKIPQYLGNMDMIYYLYDGYIEEDIVITCLAMKKKIYAVRTKCDPDDQAAENQELKARDCNDLKRMGVSNPIVFFTSKKGGQDNEKLLEHLIQ